MNGEASDKESRQAYELEKNKKKDKKRDMLATINTAETMEEKQAKKAELEVWQTNIRIIGELFKRKILAERIIHKCIYRLLRLGSDDKSLECFCQLTTTAGREFDEEQTLNCQRTQKRALQLRADVRNRLTIATLQKQVEKKT